MRVARGLWHVRNGPASIALFLVVLALLLAFPDISFGVSLTPTQPTRGVGSVDVFTTALAVTLPSLAIPEFDGREWFGGGPSRLLHLVYSAASTLVPAALVPIWGWRIAQIHPESALPSVWGLAGTPMVLASLTLILVLLTNRLLASVLPLCAFVGLVIGQHLLPESVLSSWFATPSDWSPNWGIVIGACALALGVAWHTRSISREHRT